MLTICEKVLLHFWFSYRDILGRTLEMPERPLAIGRMITDGNEKLRDNT